MTLAGLVLGGGIAAAATMNTSTNLSASTSGTSGQADVSALLSASSNPGATNASGPADRTALGHLRRAGGLYGTITYLGKDGRDRTLAFERGQITSVTSTDIVVRALDGTTMTWQLQPTTVVRQQGQKATTAALRDGQRVFVGGPVVPAASQTAASQTAAKDARLIVIRPIRPVPAENGSKA